MPLLTPQPASLDRCTQSHRTYARPFWRAPYRNCTDTLPDGVQWFEVDADGVVTELSRAWGVQVGNEQAAWDAEVRRLTAALGPPAWDSLAPSAEHPAERGIAHWRSYCADWRGPDTIEAALQLEPAGDGPSAQSEKPWRLTRYVRNGPLGDAFTCADRRRVSL